MDAVHKALFQGHKALFIEPIIHSHHIASTIHCTGASKLHIAKVGDTCCMRKSFNLNPTDWISHLLVCCSMFYFGNPDDYYEFCSSLATSSSCTKPTSCPWSRTSLQSIYWSYAAPHRHENGFMIYSEVLHQSNCFQRCVAQARRNLPANSHRW